MSSKRVAPTDYVIAKCIDYLQKASLAWPDRYFFSFCPIKENSDLAMRD